MMGRGGAVLKASPAIRGGAPQGRRGRRWGMVERQALRPLSLGYRRASSPDRRGAKVRCLGRCIFQSLPLEKGRWVRRTRRGRRYGVAKSFPLRPLSLGCRRASSPSQGEPCFDRFPTLLYRYFRIARVAKNVGMQQSSASPNPLSSSYKSVK